MIKLTRINHKPLVLNADLIEHLELTPETLISLTTGQKFMVLESADEVIERVLEFRSRICREALAGRFTAPTPAGPSIDRVDETRTDGD